MKKRLERLELILKQNGAGSHFEYLKAIQRETDRIRNHLDSIIKTVGTGESWEIKPANPKDKAIIEAYEAVHPIEPGNRNGQLERLLSGIVREGVE